ncbi:MAG TPA: DUF2802 domain-containing protein [Steroidobacteraceae bacterium]|nr:DUF2802 domain-containing protein [Steroidobacteraceae bacterium]
MDELEIYLWAGRALAIVLALGMFAWALRRLRQELAGKLDQFNAAQQQSRAEIAALTEKVAALATLVAGIPARVERPVEAARPAPRREASPVRSYETARRLARSGATVEEIVATCGVAGTEARLLRRLHGADTARESAA